MTITQIAIIVALLGGVIAGFMIFLIYYVWTEPNRNKNRIFKKGYNSGYDVGYTDGFNAHKTAEEDQMAREISDMWAAYEREHK